MAKTKSKEKQGSEFYENPEVIAQQLSKTEQFIENNKKIVFGLGGVIALIIVAFFGYRYYMNNQNEEAQKEMFQAIYWYENGEYDLALNGDGNNLGFLAILEDYGSTKAGNLASFYLGSTYLQQGQFETAIDYLEGFSSDDLLVQARSYALMGDAYMELGNYSIAAEQYGKAADYKSNEEFSPVYLMKQGLAYQKANDIEAAIGSYKTIVEDFSDSKQKTEAQKYLFQLEAQQ
ncbi:tetratricopeptide repeat protein [Marivirga sp.]|uniref:tetratricopeptide repeat protein n=1 Tax=Marivirga sp. TaxID=2018662 RepID=UPI002D7FD4BE|nr:tetratricopeptide repeat protein [Marivirga sp.]HET8860251.1 tetratricopeptide repeat protein [Marivirga sp.]